MASPAESPPCHLLRLPYELIKPVISELEKLDQITISKACTTLWQLAYPLAYNSITVTIGPNTKDSAWQNLANGVGVRYVQHLEIRSLYGSGDKPKNAEDLVAGTLVVALRRNTLLSFSILTQSTSTRAISLKTIIILLETQPSLEQLMIPCVQDSININLQKLMGYDDLLNNLRSIQFTIATSAICGETIQTIVQRSKHLAELSIRLIPSDPSTLEKVPPHLYQSSPSGPSLLSLATKLTIKGYRFSYESLALRTMSLPALRALAIVDCGQSHFFWNNLQAASFSGLSALMVRGSELCIDIDVMAFIRESRDLRELILEGKYINFGDYTTLANHVSTLEILSIRKFSQGSEYPPFRRTGEMAVVLSSFTALRHLSICVGGIHRLLPTGSIKDSNRNLDDTLTIIAGYEHLRTLHVRNRIWISPSPQQYGFQGEKWMRQCEVIEDSVNKDVMKRVGSATKSTTAAGSLIYLATTNSCEFGNDQYGFVPIAARGSKQIVSYWPTPALRSISQCKPEMMRRSEGDGYYFLETHINSVMDSSTCFRLPIP